MISEQEKEEMNDILRYNQSIIKQYRDSIKEILKINNKLYLFLTLSVVLNVVLGLLVILK